MNNIFTKVAIAAVVVSLTACSTNTRQENTLVGAGTGAVVGGLAGSIGGGWAIAAGAVVGAVIGGVIGHSMDSSDSAHVATAMNDTSVNQPVSWQNSKTGMWYKVVPTSGMMTYQGNPNCRHFAAYSKHHGKTVKTTGIMCRMTNGMWQQVH